MRPPLPSQRRSAPSLHAAASSGPAPDGWGRTANTWPGCQRSGIGPAQEGCDTRSEDAFYDSGIAFRTLLPSLHAHASASAAGSCGRTEGVRLCYQRAGRLPATERSIQPCARIMASPVCQHPRCHLFDEVHATRRRRASSAGAQTLHGLAATRFRHCLPQSRGTLHTFTVRHDSNKVRKQTSWWWQLCLAS